MYEYTRSGMSGIVIGKKKNGTGQNGTVTGLNGTVKSCKIPLYLAHKR